MSRSFCSRLLRLWPRSRCRPSLMNAVLSLILSLLRVRPLYLVRGSKKGDVAFAIMLSRVLSRKYVLVVGH